MSTTELLQALLDERGVEWWETTKYIGAIITSGGIESQYLVTTWWKSPTFGEVHAVDYKDGTLFMSCLNNCNFTPEQAIEATLGPQITGDTSDGYHTFNELYHHRAVLFSVIVRDHPELAWKSKLHHDGAMYDGMFIVGINTPKGQATYHYDIDPYWEMFDCKELERAPEWDGHTPDQAIERIATLGRGTCKLVETEHEQEIADEFGKGTFSYWAYDCSECGHENAEYGRFCAGCGAKVVDE